MTIALQIIIDKNNNKVDYYFLTIFNCVTLLNNSELNYLNYICITNIYYFQGVHS